MIGKALAHYEITAQIGKGGMGEVYQAKDTKLGRDVAIKVLPEEFAQAPDRVARFQREAKLLAALNHPNIAAIYGLEEFEDTHFLVMELIEGDTLADRIKRGPIPVDESMKLSLQIAEALEAAHEKGVIHRDLKPPNIKVTPEGKVKVLDFGLAKAYVGDTEASDLADSPTLSDVATRQGVILGTAAYMSPEQATGKSVDKRADIWAFGVVLFEMLTGKKLFGGESVTETIAGVIKSEPAWDALPPDLHPRIRLLLERCLEKIPRNRYSSMNDPRVDIQKALTDPGGVFAQPATVVERRAGMRMILPWVATIILVGIIVGVVVWQIKTPEPLPVTSFYYELPEDQQFDMPVVREVAVSPDGRQFVYCAKGGLYLRAIGELDARLIAGTAGENPVEPVFSPDGKWIAYVSGSDTKLKKIAVGGGSPMTLCSLPSIYNFLWWAGDKILYSGSQGVMQVSANGGTPELIFENEEGFASIAPQMLPDGKAVLYTKGLLPNGTNMSVMVRSLETGQTREITAGAMARYLPSGHLVYTISNVSGLPLEGTLYAVPFDIDTLELIGDPAPVIESVGGFLGCRYAISDSGTLAYIPGTGVTVNPLESTLVWVDLKGNEEALSAPPNIYLHPKISPDGNRIALVVTEQENKEIFIWDDVRKTLNKLTFDKSNNLVPIWTPDGERILYYSDHENPNSGDVYWKAADGTGNAEKLVSDPDLPLIPYALSSDGKYLVMQEIVTQTNVDISILLMGNDRKRIPLPPLQTKFVEGQPKISPDDRYIAYLFSSTDENEVYVRPFPDVDTGIWQVSQGGGHSPLWSPDGRKLFYISNDDFVMEVDVETKPKFVKGTPKILFKFKYTGVSTNGGTPWDIHPDGKRFLMMKGPGTDTGAGQQSPSKKITVIQNWFEELKERVPVE